MSADDLVAVLYHQHKIRSFRRIARLTRHQIINILCRDVDPETGLVELRGTLKGRKLKQQQEEAALAANLPCDYRGICFYVWRKRLQEEGLAPEAVEAEALRLWREETPDGRAEVAAERAAQAAPAPGTSA